MTSIFEYGEFISIKWDLPGLAGWTTSNLCRRLSEVNRIWEFQFNFNKLPKNVTTCASELSCLFQLIELFVHRAIARKKCNFYDIRRFVTLSTQPPGKHTQLFFLYDRDGKFCCLFCIQLFSSRVGDPKKSIHSWWLSLLNLSGR